MFTIVLSVIDIFVFAVASVLLMSNKDVSTPYKVVKTIVYGIFIACLMVVIFMTMMQIMR